MTTTLTVLVTGASSGIGRATATEFARQGHLVFAAARREDVLAGLAATAPHIQAVGRSRSSAAPRCSASSPPTFSGCSR